MVDTKNLVLAYMTKLNRHLIKNKVELPDTTLCIVTFDSTRPLSNYQFEKYPTITVINIDEDKPNPKALRGLSLLGIICDADLSHEFMEMFNYSTTTASNLGLPLCLHSNNYRI